MVCARGSLDKRGTCVFLWKKKNCSSWSLRLIWQIFLFSTAQIADIKLEVGKAFFLFSFFILNVFAEIVAPCWIVTPPPILTSLKPHFSKGGGVQENVTFWNSALLLNFTFEKIGTLGYYLGKYDKCIFTVYWITFQQDKTLFLEEQKVKSSLSLG